MNENGQSEVTARMNEGFKGCKVAGDCSRAGDSINELRRQMGLPEREVPHPCVNLMLDVCMYDGSDRAPEQATAVSYPRRGEQP